MSKIGLVTVLFKSDEVLEGFVQSISRQSFKDYHLYLIDNSPGERVRLLLADLFRKYPITAYTHLENPENAGVAKGNNQGIELSMAAGCSHTLILNNDIEFHQETLLQGMYDHAIAHDEKMIIPKIFYFDTRRIWMAGGRFLKSKGIVFHRGDNEVDGPAFNVPAYFEYAPTCFMLVSNQVFKSIGLMDEKYFVYYDDTDFIYRAVKTGLRILYLPTFSVYHKVSSSTGGGESEFSIYYTTRNRLYFIRKNYSLLPRLQALAYTLVTRGTRWFQYDSRQARALVRAIRDGLKISV
jgi:GT2 family glycosyltransferase